MPIPLAPIIISALPTLLEMAYSNNARDTKIQEIEAHKHIETIKMELIKLEIEANTYKVQAQKEILQSLIDAATHAFDKKIDSFREAFIHSHALVEEHQKILLEEQQELRNKLFEDMSDSQFLSLNNRLSDVSGTLIDLKKVSSLMTMEFNQRVSDTYMDMDSTKFRLT